MGIVRLTRLSGVASEVTLLELKLQQNRVGIAGNRRSGHSMECEKAQTEMDLTNLNADSTQESPI
jgi:hypothetical protein